MTVEARLASKSKLIRRVARAFVHRTGLLEYDDAVQVVSLAAWRILQETEERDEVDGLIAIAGFRRLADELRSGRVTGLTRTAWRTTKLPLSLNAPAGEDEGIEWIDMLSGGRDGYARVDDRDEVARALAALTPRHRAIVALHYYEGLSAAEIASVLGVTRTRVTEILRYAHGRMRKHLAA